MSRNTYISWAAHAATWAVLAAAGTASAQQAGVGFPIGEKSRIHTNLDVGVGFDSNPSRFSSESSTANPNAEISDWKAYFRPGLHVDVPGTSLAFGLKSQLSIHQFFGAGPQPSDTLFGGNVGVDLRLGSPSSAVAFNVTNQLVRTPAVLDDLGSVASDERTFPQWFNRGSATLTLRPGGGALELDLGYSNALSFYDQDDLPNAQQHGVVFESRLRFLPKTAAMFHADLSFYDAYRSDASAKSSPYNLLVGLVGQVTPRISVNLAAGFGDTLTWEGAFFSTLADANERNFIATAEATYSLTEATRFTLGYRRQLSPVILLANYRSDSFYARGLLAVGARLAFGALVQYELRNYGLNDRNTNILTGDVRVDYWFFEFLTASAKYEVQIQNADAVTAGMNAGLANLLAEYTRHRVFLTVGLRY